MTPSVFMRQNYTMRNNRWSCLHLQSEKMIFEADVLLFGWQRSCVAESHNSIFPQLYSIQSILNNEHSIQRR